MILRIVAIVVAAALLLLVALWGLEPASLADSLGRVGWLSLLPMPIFFTASHAFRSIRLGLLMKNPPRFSRIFSANAVGFLAINTLPLRLGEFVRPFLLKTRDSVPVGSSVAAIAMERLLDLGSLLVMLALSGLLVPAPAEPLRIGGVDVLASAWRVGLLGLGAGVVFVLALVLLGERLLLVLTALGERLGSARICSLIASIGLFQEGMTRLLTTPTRLLHVLLSTLLVWGFTLIGWWVGLSASQGLIRPFGEVIFTWSLTLAAMTTAPTPGFIGSFEAGCSWALRAVGLEAEDAMALAIAFHAVQFLFTLALGGAFLLREGVSLPELVRRARALQGAERPRPEQNS